MFTILYMTSGYMFFVYWYAFELGEILAFIILPLWILSLLSWKDNSPVLGSIKENKVLFLVISLVWITYSHVLTALCCIFITGFYLIYLLVLNKNKLKFIYNVLISGIIYLLASSFFVVSLLTSFVGQKVIGPDRWFTVSDFKSLIINSLDTPINPGNSLPVAHSATLGLLIEVSFGILLVLLCSFRKQDLLTRDFVIIALFFLFISTLNFKNKLATGLK